MSEGAIPGRVICCKVVFLNKLFYSKGAGCEWSERCISCIFEAECFVTHHAQIFESINVGDRIFLQTWN